MTDHQRDQTNDPQRPSQAEGERDKGDQRQRSQRPASGTAGERFDDPPRPSQAEGERDDQQRPQR